MVQSRSPNPLAVTVMYEYVVCVLMTFPDSRADYETKDDLDKGGSVRYKAASQAVLSEVYFLPHFQTG